MYYCTYLHTFFLESLLSIQKTLSAHKTISKNGPWLRFTVLQIYGATLFGIIIIHYTLLDNNNKVFTTLKYS